jgi:hypothetical protein
MLGLPLDMASKTKADRWIMNVLYAVGSVFDFFSGYSRSILKTGAKLIAFAILLAPLTGHADGRQVYERKDSLCLELGYQTGCELKYENGSYRAEVTLTVDDDAGEPGVVTNPRVSAGSVQVSFPDMNFTASDVLVPTYSMSTWAGYTQLQLWITSPCLTLECPPRREADPDNYSGVSEHALNDASLVANKLPFQIATDEITHQVQRRLKTTGLPVITEVKNVKVLASNESNDSATVVKAVVTIRIARRASSYP